MANDDLLRLGWLFDNTARLALLHDLAGKAAAYRDMDIGEASTIAIFVEPVLRGLGWETLEIDQVGRESRRGGQTQVADIHLCIGTHEGAWSLRALLEVKNLDLRDSDLDGRLSKMVEDVNVRLMRSQDKYNVQVCPRPANGWLLRAVLTNGRKWLFYDFFDRAGSGSAEQPTFLDSFELSEGLSDADAERLSKLLSRDAIQRLARG